MLAVIFIGAVFAIWHRNRDIVRDLFDPATMISAAGKLHAGLKPYTGVRSPMQTSVYYTGWLTECIFGRTYLGLTFGGLVQALGGGFLIGWMVQRRWSLLAGVLAGGAVALGGLIQHTMFFYNPIGLICLALIAIGTSRAPSLWPPKSLDAWLTLAALFVSGTNKLNFHALALAIGGLLLLRAWLAGELPTRGLISHIVVFAFAGLAAPLAFELLWTGATFSQWLEQVVLSPSARWEYAKHFLEAKFLLEPPHDFHHHVAFRAIGGFGLLLLAAVGVSLFASPPPRLYPRAGRILQLALLLACAAGCSLLLVTNHESVILTSVSFFICALALHLPNAKATERFPRWTGRLLLIASLAWSVFGSYAAWHGSRVLYGPNPPPRSAYERLVNAPRPLAYFEGVRFERDHLPSLRALAAKLESMEAPDGRLSGLLFGPATEWLERAYPDCIVRGMPIWYHAGTSLAEHHAEWFSTTLREAGAVRLVAHPLWEDWPASIRAWIDQNFRAERMADRYLVYHPRPSHPPPGPRKAIPPRVIDPWKFRAETASNLLLGATQPDSHADFHTAPSGRFWGAPGSWSWTWPLPVRILRGVAIARSATTAGHRSSVTFRILAGHDETERLLWEQPVTIDPHRSDFRLPFEVQAHGLPLRLEVSGSEDVIAGWTQLHISQSGPSANPDALPFLLGLVPVDGSNLEPQPTKMLRFAAASAPPDERDFLPIPSETWHHLDDDTFRVRGSVSLSRAAHPNSMVVLALTWYRAGRFEILSERRVDTHTEISTTFEAALPESGGWFGVQLRPDAGSGPDQLARVTELQQL